MSLEFRVLIDAVKLPPGLLLHAHQTTSTSAQYRYQVTWNAGQSASAEGATLCLAPTDTEVLFHHEALFRTSTTPDRLLQLTVVQVSNINNGSRTPRSAGGVNGSSTLEERRVVIGVLVIDLNAHVPKTGSMTSQQRATLAVSLSPFDPPAMIRLAVESVRSHTPFDAEAEERKAIDARRRSASRQRSVSNSRPVSPARHVVPYLPISPATYVDPEMVSPAPLAVVDERLLNEDNLEIERLRAALNSVNTVNKQLRDDNTLLRNAVQRARAEPSYTYEVQRSDKSSLNDRLDTSGRAGGEPLMSPAPHVPSSVSTQSLDSDAVTILQAEVAVLKRGLAAAREKIKLHEAQEHDLRAEIESLSMANTFQLEDIARLEDDVRRLQSTEQQAVDDGAALSVQKKLVAELQAKSRLLAAELKNEESLRGKLTDEHRTLQKEHEYLLKRRQQAEDDDALRREAHKDLIDQLEGRLAKAHKELETLHQYAADGNQRCHSIAHIVESQSKIIEEKNGKIRSLKSLLEAQDVYRKMAERSSTKGNKLNNHRNHSSGASSPSASTTTPGRTSGRVGASA